MPFTLALAEIVNLWIMLLSFLYEIQIRQMKNPFKSEAFNRFYATKDRSPQFRAFVIFLLLLICCFLVYVFTFKNTTVEASKEVLPQPATIISK
jgi:H+/Cl- antiporter ClcA